MNQPISITGISSVSALGVTPLEVWKTYCAQQPVFSTKEFGDVEAVVSKITSKGEAILQQLQKEKDAYKKLDRSVLLAIAAAKSAFTSEQFQKQHLGINIGSSRGATQLFENYHSDFLKHQKVSAYTSPTTTLGNISSWVGQELGIDGVEIGHSVTCSTALHALLNGVAWLQADMADAFIVGGSEAALTPFTMAQMNALKLYSTSENALACESMRFPKKKNTMILGEGAAVAVLEKGISERTVAVISGYGYASETLVHNSSISEDAKCFQKSMKMALQKAGLETVDAVVLHAPGTVKGDLAEYNAIEACFGKNKPLLTSNKWMVGHTFGASGMLSIEMATFMLMHNRFIENPFYENAGHFPKQLKHILVNAVGFGGNAVSIIITKP
ncbi:beta-ketoacyl synthase N-terminal-like domain-containing protein [Cochleicola gelatinilyticus]|uniref:Beta-ketoacyl synthase n=1 Tax=Cochleicola gelatinilyticus TaxID=1763537 RepID=A0A167IUE5_9FLAO|nr:beta-ketoacyl synthase N-terminal-like domain-containing protein [Cochleicola gelatinilyticus]OAB80025.1 beta-ketoacyl synthase [Cochleicola gelatinilyticus]